MSSDQDIEKVLKRVKHQLAIERRSCPDTGALSTGTFYRGDIDEIVAAVEGILNIVPLLQQLVVARARLPKTYKPTHERIAQLHAAVNALVDYTERTRYDRRS